MAAVANNIPGISIDVDDLVAIRGQLAGLSLTNIRRRSSYRSGARETRVRGRGMEYEESRAYVVGDDMRTMDWRVMARTGEAHTKVFAEEKERRFLLAVDLSASMFFGTRYAFKSWAAAQTAAHIGWLATLAGDRLGGLIVAPTTHQEIRPERGQSGLLRVFHHLAAQSRIPLPPPSTPSRLDFLLGELQRVLKPGSIVSLISDFIGISEQTPELLAAIAGHNDVNAFWIHDDIEVDPWPDGHYEVLLEDRKVGFDLHDEDENSWLLRQQREHEQRISSLMLGFDIPLFALSCNQEINPQILRNLKS